MLNKTNKEMKKVRAAIVGYGNIGHYVLEALQAAPDFEIAGVVRRAGAENKPAELNDYAVVKDKIKTSVPASGGGQAMLLSAMNTEIQEEAVAALTMLGFAAAPSQKAVLAILKDEPDAAVEKVIKLALKRL